MHVHGQIQGRGGSIPPFHCKILSTLVVLGVSMVWQALYENSTFVGDKGELALYSD